MGLEKQADAFAQNSEVVLDCKSSEAKLSVALRISLDTKNSIEKFTCEKILLCFVKYFEK